MDTATTAKPSHREREPEKLTMHELVTVWERTEVWCEMRADRLRAFYRDRQPLTCHTEAEAFRVVSPGGPIEPSGRQLPAFLPWAREAGLTSKDLDGLDSSWPGLRDHAGKAVVVFDLNGYTFASVSYRFVLPLGVPSELVSQIEVLRGGEPLKPVMLAPTELAQLAIAERELVELDEEVAAFMAECWAGPETDVEQHEDPPA